MFGLTSFRGALQTPYWHISRAHLAGQKSLPMKPFFPQYQPVGLKRTITSTALAAGAGILGGIVSTTLQLFIKNRIEQKRETDLLVTSNFSRIYFITNDLQSRLYNILEGGGVKNYRNFGDREKRDFEEYTSFVFARFIAMINKMENDNVDIRFFQVKSTRTLMKKIQDAKALMADNSYGSLLTFYRPQQQLISSYMKPAASQDGLIDYKEFLERIKSDDSPLKQFNSAVSDFIRQMAEEENEKAKEWYLQVQKLQHYLIDIMLTIDPGHLVISKEKSQKFQF